MSHILSGCKIVLTQGRYSWRHDKVLAVLADILEQKRRKKQPAKARQLLSTIAFVKEGQIPVVPSQVKQNLLQSAQGWEMEVDLGRKLHFSEVVLSTTLRRNIIVVSRGKEDQPGGVDGTVGGWLGGSCREEKRQMPATFPRRPGQGVDNMADDGGSRMSRIPSSICVESIDEGWTEVASTWGKQPFAGREKRQREPPVGSGTRETAQAGSLEERGSDLASHCWPANWRVLWLRIETPRESWGPPDDLSSRPRLHPLEIGVY